MIKFTNRDHNSAWCRQMSNGMNTSVYWNDSKLCELLSPCLVISIFIVCSHVIYLLPMIVVCHRASVFCKVHSVWRCTRRRDRLLPSSNSHVTPSFYAWLIFHPSLILRHFWLVFVLVCISSILCPHSHNTDCSQFVHLWFWSKCLPLTCILLWPSA